MKTYVGPGNCTRTFTQCSFKKNKNNKQTNKTPQKKKKKTAKTLSILITIQLLMDSLEHFFCSFIDINTVL